MKIGVVKVKPEALEEKGEPRKGHAKEEKLEHTTFRKNKLPFFGARGSDPGATMKGDTPTSAPPTAKVKKPPPVRSGGAYRIERKRRAP